MTDLPDEISCDNCVAACCRAPIWMQMTQEEIDRHRRKMDLRQIRRPSVYGQRVTVPTQEEPMSVQPGHGLYLLASGCSNLTEDYRCSVYEERPTCCRTYEMGSPACLSARRKAGLDADRPVTEAEMAPVSKPDSRTRLRRQYFPDARSDGAPSDPAPAAAPPTRSGPFFLAQARTSVSRDTRWISDRLAQCKASDWSRATRCAGWSVNALVAHLVTCLQTADAVARAAIDRRVAKSPRDFKGDRHVAMRAFESAADNVAVALDRMTPEALAREVEVSDEGVLLAEHVIEVLVMELAVHGLDLADAFGEERHLQPDAIAAASHLIPEFLDPAVTPSPGAAYVLRSPDFELQFGWDGDEWSSSAGTDPCIIEGPSESVLLFALGRVSFAAATLETNRPDEARAFKRYLAGP